MDSISGDSPKKILSDNVSGNFRKNPSTSISSDTDLSSNPTKLDALNQLAKNSIRSAPDIREDKIREAKKLMNDPDWLSDENLDLLSAKIFQVEDFNS
jgi:hypothetical protein